MATDIVRVQDAGMRGADDAAVLEWAASESRVLLTHDESTMPTHAIARVRSNQPMPGVIVARQSLAIGETIESIVLVAL